MDGYMSAESREKNQQRCGNNEILACHSQASKEVAFIEHVTIAHSGTI